MKESLVFYWWPCLSLFTGVMFGVNYSFKCKFKRFAWADTTIQTKFKYLHKNYNTWRKDHLFFLWRNVFLTHSVYRWALLGFPLGMSAVVQIQARLFLASTQHWPGFRMQIKQGSIESSIITNTRKEHLHLQHSAGTLIQIDVQKCFIVSTHE